MVDAILPPPAVEVPLLAEPPALAVPPPHGLEVHGHTAGGQLHSHRPHQQHPPNPQAVLVLYLVLVRSILQDTSCSIRGLSARIAMPAVLHGIHGTLAYWVDSDQHILRALC